ncbi:pepsin/retropepsin-like aspartic protease family protein [Mesonia maritima]|uniref:Aspartyl protease n=1 Tax=Mesonia maritima TaxID=1793873 RepID=A0ABU1K5N7_9FLAO|nr:pepsin/retropepsin-like aspartic protease family protein [Mesonia maritima]MDR6300931.1 putative aspartyl protease [Mesonia maritima]
MVLVVQPIFSQNENKCENIVEQTFEAIDNKSSDHLIQYLSEDFKIAGQTGEIAKKILGQLFSQLGETVNSYKEKSRTKKGNNSLEIVFSVDYEKMGNKKSVFTFNENCELEELELFQMEVKVLEEGATKIKKPNQEIIEIPFQKVRNLIAFEVLLNGKKRVFILDTGSPKVVLNSKYIDGQKEQKSISSTKDVNNNNISGMDITSVQQLSFGGIEINEQKVVTTDLSHLEKSLEAEIYGLIGYEMIKDYDVLLDYENQNMILINPNTFENFKSKNLNNHQITRTPFEMRGHIPVIEVRIDNQNLNLGIDTGAEANLIDQKLFDELQKNINDFQKDNLVGGDVNSSQVHSGLLEAMTINNRVYQNVYTVFTNIEHLNKDKTKLIDGLIGYPILSQQKLIISFDRKEILFIE